MSPFKFHREKTIQISANFSLSGSGTDIGADKAAGESKFRGPARGQKTNEVLKYELGERTWSIAAGQLSQLGEPSMIQCISSRDAIIRRVPQHLRQQIDAISIQRWTD